MKIVEIKGMASIVQISHINELVEDTDNTFPVSAFLKNVTHGRAACIDELTGAQAEDVIRILEK